jgi:hypothetical protein
MGVLAVEPTGAKNSGPCPCCGHDTRRVWGLVRTRRSARAAYFVQWAPGLVPEHGANIDLIIGKWGERATAADRVLVALEFRRLGTGPAVMVIDAGDRPAVSSDLVGRALQRAEVIGRPVAERAFAIVDAVLAQDKRVAELLG